MPFNGFIESFDYICDPYNHIACVQYLAYNRYGAPAIYNLQDMFGYLPSSIMTVPDNETLYYLKDNQWQWPDPPLLIYFFCNFTHSQKTRQILGLVSQEQRAGHAEVTLLAVMAQVESVKV